MVEISIKVTIPEFKISNPALRSDILRVMRRKTVPDTISLFKQTTEGWQNKPSWSAAYSNQPMRVTAKVFPSGKNADQYNLVEFGAKPHVIRPKRGGLLRFQRGYRAATKPKILSSRSKQRFGQLWTAKSVNHPGFQAREFSEEVAKEIAPVFQEHVKDAISV